MHIQNLLTKDQLNNFNEHIASELIQKIEKGNIQDLSCYSLVVSLEVRAETVVLIAAALAKCSSLHTIDMGANELREHGPATAEKLALAPSLHTVTMSFNELEEYGPATAKYLAQCPNLHKVNMRYNELEEYGLATAAEFDCRNQCLSDLIMQTIPSMCSTVLNPDEIPTDVVDLIGVFLPPICYLV